MMNRHRLLLVFFFLLTLMERTRTETVSGCTLTNQNRLYLRTNQTFVTLSCHNDGWILVRNLTFGVHQRSSNSSRCSYHEGDCITRTTYIGMECNGLTHCDLDLNPQYLHICSQYSDYMMLDYSCLQGQSLTICDNQFVVTSPIFAEHRAFLRSPNYPHEYDNGLNCSCTLEMSQMEMKFVDFYLEERDESNQCTRDYLQIGNDRYCDSKAEHNAQQNSSSIDFKFITNDVITRKGFWLMITSTQSMRLSCRNMAMPLLSTSLISSTTTIELTSIVSTINQREKLSFLLGIVLIIVLILFVLNSCLLILCWKQRDPLHSKINKGFRLLFCLKRRSLDSSSSSTTYHDTLDISKRTHHTDTTPSTSITTGPTGVYEDPNELLTLQQQQNLTFCPMVFSSCSMMTHAGYNRMRNFSSGSCHCHCNLSHGHYVYDSSHVYETIQEKLCPYQRFATATLRREQVGRCSCCHTTQHCSTGLDETDKTSPMISKPETLV